MHRIPQRRPGILLLVLRTSLLYSIGESNAGNEFPGYGIALNEWSFCISRQIPAILLTGFIRYLRDEVAT